MEEIMRRISLWLLMVVACAAWATPAAAQYNTSPRWLVNAGVGPSVGTVGTTPAAVLAGGVQLSDRWSIVGEAGVLPRASADKGQGIAPALPALVSSDDRYINHGHANANVSYHFDGWKGLRPYLTGGVGAFVGQAVERGLASGAEVTVQGRATHAATNLGAGVRYWLTDWLGLTADYRQFQVYADDTQYVNRFAAGITLGIK
jgi:hypothetical protein